MKSGFKNYILGVFSGLFCSYLLFTISTLQSFNKQNINQNQNEKKESIKENIIENIKQENIKDLIDYKLNYLYPDWNNNIINNKINNKKTDGGLVDLFHKHDHISFIKFNFEIMRPNSIELAPATNFWYSYEDTYHSAAYIVTNEKQAVNFWRTKLDKSMKNNMKNNINSYCLDIGSNGGFYSLLSRSVGCVTLAVDTQPW
jgi:hypothetical protein